MSVPGIAAARPVFSCYGDQLDLEGNEIGQGDISVEILNRGKKLRLIYDNDASEVIELFLNSPNGRDLVYQRHENKFRRTDGVNVSIKSDFLEATPNSEFYIYIFKSDRGVADKFRTLECRDR